MQVGDQAMAWQETLEEAERQLAAGQDAAADAAYARVLAQVEGQPEALLGRARVAVGEGAFERAEGLLRELLAAQPEHAEACLGMAVVEHSQGRLDAAAHWYERAAALRPDDPGAAYNLGVVRHEQGRLAEAEAAYRQSCAGDAGPPQAFNNLGNILLAGERLDEAAAAYREALRRQPDLPEALHGLGLAEQRLGRPQAAEAAFRRVLAVSPGYPPALSAMGLLCQQRGEAQQAVEWYRQALQARPGDVDVLFNLGKLYQDHKHPAAAEQAFRAALEFRRRQPGGAAASVHEDELYYSLGGALRKQGKWAEWRDNLGRFGVGSPDSVLLSLERLAAARYAGDAEAERQALDHLFAHRYTVRETGALRTLLGLLSYFDLSQEQALSAYRQFDTLCRQRVAAWPTLHLPERAPDGRIRLGYLSADLRRHVMGHMMWEVLSRHDRDRFEIHCYSLSRVEDDLTRDFRDRCDSFTVVAGLTARAAAERIAADGLDILVDLVSHTEGAEPEILAFKPARVQITHIANSDAVGLAAIDFKLTDHACDPPANQRGYIETLLPMAGCVYPYRHLPPAATDVYSRQRLGIADEAIVLGAFVSILKLGSRCLSLWRRVLERLPAARLAFSPNNAFEIPAYRALAEAAGIAPERLLFLPNDPDRAVARARYGVVDMVLDTLPCGGVNGTLEALDMGVPVVTLLGERHCERTSYSILSNLGVDLTIATGEAEYVALAARLAEDPGFRAEVTDAIRRGLADSPLVDMDAHVRHLEDAYRAALAGRGESKPAQ